MSRVDDMIRESIEAGIRAAGQPPCAIEARAPHGPIPTPCHRCGLGPCQVKPAGKRMAEDPAFWCMFGFAVGVLTMMACVLCAR